MTKDLSTEMVVAFCQACSWAHEVWCLHRGLQNGLATDEKLAGRHGYFFNRLSVVTQEYTLLQICKLHDPAVQGRNTNVSISSMVERSQWSSQTRAALERMRSELDVFHDWLVPARNKRLAHNDQEANLTSATLGCFPTGLDDTYFETLQRFVNVVHGELIGGPYPFDNFVKVDADWFLADLRHSAQPPLGGPTTACSRRRPAR